VIARVADNCLWFGRYVERVESTARLLRVTRELAFDAELSAARCWEPLVIVSGEYPAFIEKEGPEAAGNGELVQRYLTWNAKCTVSMKTSVAAAREIARTMRDVLSHDVWTEVNQMYLWVNDPEGERAYEDEREDFYREIQRRTQLVLGLVRSTMLHDEPMHFLWLGVMLERVGQIARILDMHHHTLTGEQAHQVLELSLWLALLRACSGAEAFMKRNRGRMTRAAVSSFLIFEPEFPRSLSYCLHSARGVMRKLWLEGDGPGRGSKTLALMESLCEWMEKEAPKARTQSLHDLLTTVVDRTSAVSAALGEEILGPPVKPVEKEKEAEADAPVGVGQ
jgi:uncharacterized alpha-E superfamily protein